MIKTNSQKEIGSEFWIDQSILLNAKKYIDNKIGEDSQLLLSGRTAIDFVLDDIPNKITSVYMPSYCCCSILQPFIERNINIEFYDVICSSDGISYLIDFEKKCDIFFAISYFGFHSTNMDSKIEIFKKRGIVVIEDITHRFLSEMSYCANADYVIASLRKWFPIPSGGIAVKQKGVFKERQIKKPSLDIINTKIEAMTKKAEYIYKLENDISIQKDEKNIFLDLFSIFNEDIKVNYRYMEIDAFSKQLLINVNIKSIKKIRRENANILFEYFNKHDYIKPLISAIDIEKDCPLFFPVRVKSEIRNDLKTYLVKNKIFCPIHWPINNKLLLNDKTKQIYDEELSLICDQRYKIKDINRIINVINDFNYKK